MTQSTSWYVNAGTGVSNFAEDDGTVYRSSGNQGFQPDYSATGGGNYASSPYGTAGSDTVTYTIADVADGDEILASKINEIYDRADEERQRRGKGHTGWGVGAGNQITHDHLQNILWQMNDAGYSNVWFNNGWDDVGDVVYAAHVNVVINEIQNAGSQCICNCNYCTCNCNYCTCDCNYCTCNCNYCTCNCNYCTCNCNFSCPCNCNYSDMRLKRDIEFIEERNGLNIYTFKYLWDDVKRTGVMAQEILKSKWKDAVMQDKNGYYMVDYGMLPYERN